MLCSLPMPTSPGAEIGQAREVDLALLIADLAGYTALTETHGALQASETVLRFTRMVESCLDPGVAIVNSIGDDVFCAGADSLAVVRTALRLNDAIRREPRFPRIRTGIHRGLIVEREARLFGASINLTARLAAHATGGQILCTAVIADAVRALANVEPRLIGDRRFKNVLHPVKVFELVRVSERRSPTVIDPVCRMQVVIDRAVSSCVHQGVTYRFCSAGCAADFAKTPELYVSAG